MTSLRGVTGTDVSRTISGRSPRQTGFCKRLESMSAIPAIGQFGRSRMQLRTVQVRCRPLLPVLKDAWNVKIS